MGIRAAMIAVLVVACGDDTAPSLPLAGIWHLIGFSDAGVDAVTTGTAVFRQNRTLEIAGTVTFPGEPPESFDATGTYREEGETVTLTTGTDVTRWHVEFARAEATLTEVEPPPANVIRLRRS
ncbi:MAG: hypothetical protein ACREL9_08315 [Gemmatimonadales bacterium]